MAALWIKEPDFHLSLFSVFIFLTPLSPSLLLSLSPFIHIYWCLVDGNIWSWRLMALYISLKKHHTHLSAPSLSGLFFSADCFFFWTFSSSVSFFPPLCHINKIHHQRSSLFMSMRPWKCFRFSFKLVSGCRILFKFFDCDEWWIREKKSEPKWTVFPLIGLTYYKSNAV